MSHLSLRDLAFLARSSSGGLTFTEPATNPTSFANLLSWYRAADLSLAADASVDTWNDKTAGARNLSASGTARPTFKTNILDGMPAVRFDGNDKMTASGVWGLGNGTIIALMVPNPGGYFLGYTGYYVHCAFNASSSNAINFYNGFLGFGSNAFSGAATAPKLVTIACGGGVQTWENKTSRGTDTGGYGININTLGGAGSNFFTGDIVELVIYSAQKDGTTLASLYDNYFKVLYPSLP